MYPNHRRRLDLANIELGRELLAVKSSLDTYTLIALNEASIAYGKVLFRHLRHLSLLHVALGLAKIFEREKTHALCSVSGILRLAKRLAKDTPIEDPSASKVFAEKYGVDASGDWIRDVNNIFDKQRPIIRKHLRKISRTRNTRIAHLQQDPAMGVLPSVATFQELLAFGFAFHVFVNAAFLNTEAHPILQDEKVHTSLSAVLRKVGVVDPVVDLPDI